MKKLIDVRYSKAIIPFFILSIILIIFLLYFANITRKIEKENLILNNKISHIKEQININEIEFSLYTSYDYLLSIQQIYFQKVESNGFNNRISFNNLKKRNLNNLYSVGLK